MSAERGVGMLLIRVDRNDGHGLWYWRPWTLCLCGYEDCMLYSFFYVKWCVCTRTYSFLSIKDISRALTTKT
jgi:hypothetical protein